MFDLPASVRLETGRGGLPVLLVDGPAARAQIYLHGGTVTNWTPHGSDPVLWVSSASRFTAEAPIRGGVPICFPWFGAHPGESGAPSHGFARLSEWSLVGAQDDGEDVVVRLDLTDDEATRESAWPHRFEAVYTVVVGSRLSLRLEVTNRGEEAVVFEEALHTYFDVRNILATEVSGLEGTPFHDLTIGPEPVPGEPDPVRFRSETDRIYLGGTRVVTTVRDDESGRSVLISRDGSAATVIWNPWADKAAGLVDLGDDEWRSMVCVEVGNVRDAAIRLEPGRSHTMSTTFELSTAPELSTALGPSSTVDPAANPVATGSLAPDRSGSGNLTIDAERDSRSTPS